MRIAFVGKGGSGKSTLSSLFALYISQSHKTLMIDADINQHIQGLLGIEGNLPAISFEPSLSQIKSYLIGKNNRITDIRHIVKSTPPGIGSSFLTVDENNFIIRNYSKPYSPTLSLMNLGTYKEEGIGQSCYHNNLAICENILSHSITQKGEYIIVDMVAGNDAFSNTLHIQFDLIVLVVEPTQESKEVYLNYKNLSQQACMRENVIAVGNKIMDSDDKAFIEGFAKENLVGYMPYINAIKKLRQNGNTLDTTIEGIDNKIFDTINDIAKTKQKSDKERLEGIWKLHKIYTQQQYIKARLGDISHQIDEDFTYANAMIHGNNE